MDEHQHESEGAVDVRRARAAAGAMTLTDLRDLHSQGPDSLKPGAWQVLDEELRRRSRVFGERGDSPVGGPATCPRCGSSSIQAVPVRKANLLRAWVAQDLLGTAAGVAAGSDTVIQALCLKCGANWIPGSAHEDRLRALSGALGSAARLQAEEDREEGSSSIVKRVLIGLGIGVVVLWALLLATR